MSEKYKLGFEKPKSQSEKIFRELVKEIEKAEILEGRWMAAQAKFRSVFETSNDYTDEIKKLHDERDRARDAWWEQSKKIKALSDKLDEAERKEVN